MMLTTNSFVASAFTHVSLTLVGSAARQLDKRAVPQLQAAHTHEPADAGWGPAVRPAAARHDQGRRIVRDATAVAVWRHVADAGVRERRHERDGPRHVGGYHQKVRRLELRRVENLVFAGVPAQNRPSYHARRQGLSARRINRCTGCGVGRHTVSATYRLASSPGAAASTHSLAFRLPTAAGKAGV